MMPNNKTVPVKPPVVPAAGKTQPHKTEPIRNTKNPEPDHTLWDESLRDSCPLHITLLNGEVKRGRILGFGLYSICIDMGDGKPFVIFKNAIATASRP